MRLAIKLAVWLFWLVCATLLAYVWFSIYRVETRPDVMWGWSVMLASALAGATLLVYIISFPPEKPDADEDS